MGAQSGCAKKIGTHKTKEYVFLILKHRKGTIGAGVFCFGVGPSDVQRGNLWNRGGAYKVIVVEFC